VFSNKWQPRFSHNFL